jgi:signal transduction histidine kinase
MAGGPVVEIAEGPVRKATPQWVIAASGVAVLAFAGLMIAVGWPQFQDRKWAYGLADAVGLSFAIAGWITWSRSRANRTGLMMLLAGAFWYMSNLQFTGVPVLEGLGFWWTYLDVVIFAHLALVYPDGYLTSRLERWMLFAAYASYLILQGFRYLAEGQNNPIGLHDSFSEGWADILSINALVFGTLFWMGIIRRWHQASKPARRLHRPVWLGILVTNATLGFGAVVSILHRGDIGIIATVCYGVSLVTLPFVFLSGVLRARLAERRVADLIIALDRTDEPARLRDLLAKVLDDPGLLLGYWAGDGTYADADGRIVELPRRDDPDLTATEVRDGDEPLAVIVHDLGVTSRPALVRAVVAGARLALSNARLQTLQHGQLDELRASRERLAVAALTERRRIERDLHDGVQQRLLRLSWLAQRARGLVNPDASGEDVVPVLNALVEEVSQTTAELRDLAHGIHPSIVAELGLASAVMEFALQAPLTLTVDLPRERFAEAVEATAFFVIMEAIVNAAKHSRVDSLEVRGHVDDDCLIVSIADAGVGGADARRGTGLRNMSDRVAALGGTLEVDSPVGGGTRVTVVLPFNQTGRS